MDRRERYEDPQEALRVALESWQAKMWTALPGVIQSFNAGQMTCTVKPTISTKALDEQGNARTVEIPVLLDCPVVFPSGGGCTLTFPIAAGDECLVVFASRCIDGWWAQSGVQAQAEFRMHDLSDGFVIPGPKSVPNAFSASTSDVQLRTNDGAAIVAISPSTHDITATTSGNVTITAPTITLSGNIVLNGPITQTAGTGGSAATLIGPLNVTNDVKAQGTSLHTHVHTDPQGGNTGPPV